MEYIYETFHTKTNLRVDTSTSLEDVENNFEDDVYYWDTHFVVVYSGMLSSTKARTLYNQEDLNNWRVGQERSTAWKPEGFGSTAAVKDTVRPSHYKDTVPGMMYIEMMQYMLAHIKDPMEATLLGHVYKYLMRSGKKEDNSELQEYSKGLWYLEFLVAYIKNGRKPIKAEDIRKILDEKATI
jgi:hypothetical protein